ncbi:MAG: two-component regulator propeller domain-containing protein [Bacteroidota bacterium]|nr:two-component regulator propeller domain-containing protein [Bacteroidota bacterium]
MQRIVTIAIILGMLGAWAGLTGEPLYAQARFDRIGLEQGLPYSRVICLLQDRQGYMWVGTRAGLGRWDGYSMTVFRSSPDDSTALSNPNIWALYEDHAGTIWVGTEGGGLNRYDARRDHFTRYMHDPRDSSSLSQDRVSCIFEDLDRNLWVATSGGGLDRFHPNTGTFSHLYGDRQPYPCGWGIYQRTVLPLDDGRFLLTSVGAGAAVLDPLTSCATRNFLGTNIDRIGCPNILDVLRDSRGGFWFATSEGLVRLLPESSSFVHYPIVPGGTIGTSDRDIYDIFEDSRGLIWIGTGAGLDLYDPVRDRFTHYYHDPLDPYSLADNVVYVIREDRAGNVWVGTQRGISVMTSRNLEFEHYRHTLASGSLVHDDVTALAESRDGSIWIGTFGGGICRFNPRGGIFTVPPQSELSERRVYSLLEDRTGVLWAGTYGGGLNRYDPSNGTWTVFRASPNDSTGLTHNDIHTLLQDRGGRIWIGTNSGVNRLDPATGRFTPFLSDSLSLLQHQVRALHHDGRTLWVGSVGGLYRIDRSGAVVRGSPSSDAPGGPFRQHISSIIGSGDGTLWIGTLGAGLYELDTKRGEWKRYTIRHGLSSDAVTAMFIDRRRQLWITTHGGLSAIDLRSGEIRRYDTRDGLINIQFNPGAALRSSDGTLYFGGTNGFTVRSASPPDGQRLPPPVVLTELRIWNTPVVVGGGDGVLTQPLAMTRRITLPHDQNMITISFAALDFTAPARNRYRYYLEGQQEQWIDAGNSRTATFTNISPGEYVFHVVAANPAGIWNEEGATLVIVVEPPLWRSVWAYLLYLVVGVGLIGLLVRIRVHRVRLQEQLERERLQAEQLQEVDQLKSRFFSNISHEFRTPLTLILGPAGQIAERAEDGWTRKKAGVISVHARRLLQLVNQILDLSRIDAGKMELQLRHEDIVPLLRGVSASFASHAEERGIQFRFSAPTDAVLLPLDRDAIERILVNLLSNAFRFTEAGGEIAVVVAREEYRATSESPPAFRVSVTISDSGCGIPAERLPYVFDRFYRAHEHSGSGTGIGLALVRELVALHGGTIDVRSREGSGTTFRIALPLPAVEAAPTGIDAVVQSATPAGRTEELLATGVSAAVESEHESIYSDMTVDASAPLVLLVDDHADLRAYMRDILVPRYRVLEAADGSDGAARAAAAQPDLIISDVMMPVMDGYGLCRAIRGASETSHIPVILLTARGDERSRMLGLEEGANEYLTKPFDPDELLLRVRNLIALRQAQAAQFGVADGFRLDPKQYVSRDQEFLDRVIALVDAHLTSENLSPTLLFEEIGMSRSRFERKLKALTDMSPARFIRGVRLRRAKEMLEQGAGSIAEITFGVGFGSQAYFTTCFREEFGCTPGEFLRNR